VVAVEPHGARARCIQQPDQLEKGALARPRRAHYGDQLACLEAHTGVTQRHNVVFSHTVRTPDVVELHQHGHTSRSTSTGSTPAALPAGSTPDARPSAAANRKMTTNSAKSAR